MTRSPSMFATATTAPSRTKQTAIGFLMILMQRLITSSTAAIRTALERRLAVLDLPQGQLSLFPEDVGEDWAVAGRPAAARHHPEDSPEGLKDERKEVELLLSAARRCEASGPDVKAEALLDRIQQQQREENDPTLKVLIFTEFVPTQAMLADFLERRGFAVVCLNGAHGSGGTPAGRSGVLRATRRFSSPRMPAAKV